MRSWPGPREAAEADVRLHDSSLLRAHESASEWSSNALFLAESYSGSLRSSVTLPTRAPAFTEQTRTQKAPVYAHHIVSFRTGGPNRCSFQAHTQTTSARLVLAHQSLIQAHLTGLPVVFE